MFVVTDIDIVTEEEGGVWIFFWVLSIRWNLFLFVFLQSMTSIHLARLWIIWEILQSVYNSYCK